MLVYCLVRDQKKLDQRRPFFRDLMDLNPPNHGLFSKKQITVQSSVFSETVAPSTDSFSFFLAPEKHAVSPKKESRVKKVPFLVRNHLTELGTFFLSTFEHLKGGISITNMVSQKPILRFDCWGQQPTINPKNKNLWKPNPTSNRPFIPSIKTSLGLDPDGNELSILRAICLVPWNFFSGQGQPPSDFILKAAKVGFLRFCLCGVSGF